MNSLKFAFLASVIVVAACQKPPTVEDPPPAAPAPNAGTMVTETEIAIPAELVDEAFTFGKSTFTIKKEIGRAHV